MLCSTRSTSQLTWSAGELGQREGDLGDDVYLKSFNTCKVSWLTDVQLRRRTGNSQVVTLQTSVNLNGWHSPGGKVTKTWVMPTTPSSFPRPTRTPLTVSPVLFQHSAPSAIMNQPDLTMKSKPVDGSCPIMEYHFENHSLGLLRKSTNLYHARSPKYWLHSFKLTT